MEEGKKYGGEVGNTYSRGFLTTTINDASLSNSEESGHADDSREMHLDDCGYLLVTVKRV